jgi:hypothetical protein
MAEGDLFARFTPTGEHDSETLSALIKQSRGPQHLADDPHAFALAVLELDGWYDLRSFLFTNASGGVRRDPSDSLRIWRVVRRFSWHPWRWVMSTSVALAPAAAVVAVDVGKAQVAVLVTDAQRRRLLGPVEFSMTGSGVG